MYFQCVGNVADVPLPTEEKDEDDEIDEARLGIFH